MKTKIILAAIMLITLYARAQQIPNLSKKKTPLDSKILKVSEVPLFKGVKAENFKRGELGKMLEKNYPKTTSTIVPKTVSSSASALNVVLTPGSFRTDKAGLYFLGADYTNSSNNLELSINFPQGALSNIMAWFKSKPNKYYYVQLEYKQSINCTGSLKLNVRAGGSSYDFPVKNGSNKHVFVVEAKGTHTNFELFSNYRFRCSNKRIPSSQFNYASLEKVTIQELPN